MANRIFGEARAKLADGRELTLRMDFNALIEVEDADGRPMSDIEAEMKAGKVRARTSRALLYGALRAHHPEIGLEEAGDLFLTDGGELARALEEAMSAMQAPGAAKKNPRKGAAAKAA